MTTQTSFHAGALADLRSVLSDDILAELGEFDGSETILVPNSTEVFDLSRPYDGPQIIDFGGDVLKTFPSRISWDLSATSTSLRITNAATMANRPDWNMVLVGTRHAEVHINDRWIPDYEFFALLLTVGRKGSARSVEDVITSLKQRGLDLKGSMPMYLQHLGADPAQFHNVIRPFFERHGARDNTDEIQTTGTKSRTASSVRFEGGGLKVASFEVSTSDRSRSQTGTGFISFLDGTYTTVRAIFEADRVISAANAVINDPNADAQDRALAQDRKEAAISYWNSGTQRSRRPFHNWGGTSRVVDLGTSKVQYFATPVPCGRLTLLDAKGNPEQLSVWQSARLIPGGTTAMPADLAADMTEYAQHLQEQHPITAPDHPAVPIPAVDEEPF